MTTWTGINKSTLSQLGFYLEIGSNYLLEIGSNNSLIITPDADDWIEPVKNTASYSASSKSSTSYSTTNKS